MRHRPWRLRAGAVAALAGLVLLAPGSTLADPPAPRTAADHDERARQLDEKAQRLEKSVAELRADVEAATAEANAALDAYQQAVDNRRRLVDAAAAADTDLRVATAARQRAREKLDAYVVAAYQAGGTTGGVTGVASVLESGNPTIFVEQLTMLGRVGESEATLVNNLREAEEQQQEAADRARRLADEAVRAADEAEAAKTRADDLVAEQTRALKRLQRELTRTRAQAREAAIQAAAEKELEELARQAALDLEELAASGECVGGDVSGYPNGLLPRSALCPVWGAPGHVLRADAAAAFNALSREYSTVFGEPVCVTDSYRTFAQQVDVKRRKPTLAATPGTSNHGWGRAVDLCGGVENGGTPTHEWLRLNAPRFGWFNPAWAQAGGSGPYEPWHWEYAG